MQGRMLRRGFLTGAASVAGAILVSCTGESDEDTTTFVGRVERTQVAIAVVATEAQAVVYLCDGHNGRRFDAMLTQGMYTTPVDDLGTLQITVTATGVTGFLEAAGTRYPITALPATGRATLLTARSTLNGTIISAGWVVFPDGSETGGHPRHSRRHQQYQAADVTACPWLFQHPGQHHCHPDRAAGPPHHHPLTGRSCARR